MGSYGGRGPTVNAVLWTETALAAVFVLARCYTRRWILRSEGLDDLFLVLTWLLLAGYAACVSTGTLYGIGQHRDDIPAEDYILAQKFEVIGQGICIFNIAVSKAAVAFLLLRIVTRTWHKVFVWFCVVTNTILASWATIAIFIQCLPTEKVWNMAIEGNCWLDFAKVGITCSAYAVVVDFALATIPCFIVWQLNMKPKDKILTICGLSLGVFAAVCGILRTSALGSLRSYDEYILDTVDMLIYSGTENFVSALCASIPVLRPLYSKLRHGYGSNDDSFPSRSYHLSVFNNSNDAERALRGHPSGAGMETRIYAGEFARAADNASEEEILGEAKSSQKDSNVNVETKVSVNYSKRSPNKDS